MGWNTSLTRLFKDIFLKVPLVCPPMAGASGAELAAQVSLAGGLGFIGAGYHKDSAWLLSQLKLAKSYFPSHDHLPIGVGFVAWHLAENTHVIRDMLDQAPPLCAVWFAFGEAREFAREVKRKWPHCRLFFQVTTVAEALHVKEVADVVVAQGSDSGGHGARENSTTVALTAEIADALPDKVVLAAGGLVDGRGLTAALALGAAGACMGTRFAVSKESMLHPEKKGLMVEVVDGAETVRTDIFDLLRGQNWPKEYDGRAVRNEATRGVCSIEELKKGYAIAEKDGDITRAVTWAGTGVGLIKEILPAGDIVQNISNEALERIKLLGSYVSQ
ncbi:uncharacterized protein VTP21DRAFT_10928 [Calcarisporiella thermophila]|uniref:uncharacterized protein n=1 Tax=Calcarisporiella thermophila TaxID=911321 RepID=UPI003743575D